MFTDATDASFAIVHDSEWMSVMTPDENFPDPQEILRRVLEEYSVERVIDGVQLQRWVRYLDLAVLETSEESGTEGQNISGDTEQGGGDTLFPGTSDNDDTSSSEGTGPEGQDILGAQTGANLVEESPYSTAQVETGPRVLPPSYDDLYPDIPADFSAPDTPKVKQSDFFPEYTAPASSSSSLQIHPWLNGDAPSPDFYFDIANGAFMPLKRVQLDSSADTGGLLSVAECNEPAFHPPVQRLRIIHPHIPWWPIDLVLPPEMEADEVLPITLGDVLIAIHRAMHTPISHRDWARLSTTEGAAVARTFTARCRAEARRTEVGPSNLRDVELAETQKGVKRVDYLDGKTSFRGLIRDPDGHVLMVST
ncbi:hypothetical protein DFH06DRAFT_452642 [Mycena polygramma]|nr:hypothetical protein DFH06DRAFT_452642 [Mycena polygramma]